MNADVGFEQQIIKFTNVGHRLNTELCDWNRISIIIR